MHDGLNTTLLHCQWASPRVAFAVALWLMLLAAPHARAEAKTVIEHNESVAPKALEWPLEVPPFSVEHQVRLSLAARIDWPRLAGSNPWIRVSVNGNLIGREDLLNKRDSFTLRNGVDLTWFNAGRWRILYSPDFVTAVTDKQSPYGVDAKDEPYRFVWDITRHVKPGRNTLRIEHLKVLQKPSTLVLRTVRVEVGKPIEPPGEETVEPAPTGPLPIIVATGRQTLPLTAVAHDATLEVHVGDRSIAVRTRMSLPGGRWREARSSGNSTWSAGPCRVSRQVMVREDHVHVADTFTNTTGQLVGVMVEHGADMVGQPEALYLAGRKSFTQTANAREAMHPSVFARFPGWGVGLVAEDDVFRVHVRSFHNTRTFGLGDDRLGLAPNASVTLEWSIYPLLGADAGYWAFVNALRRNWDVNYTIPGAFVFGGYLPKGLTGEQYAKWMHDRGVRYLCGGIAKYPDGKYAHGTGITFAPEFIAAEHDWTTKMAAADPTLVPLAYFHAQCCTEPECRTKYADARLLDDKGEQIDYPYRYELPLFVPTENNSYGKALWRTVDALINQVGAKGIYWDEMAYSVKRYASGLPWDGHTVAIDPRTHEVTGKLTSIPLIMQPLKLKIVDYIQGKGLFFLANTQPHTRTMLRKHLIRFVETGTYSAMSNTHLACPLGLGNHNLESTQAESVRNVRELLKRGGVYYGHYYNREPAPWNFTSVMFPITPQQIGPGYVLGAERIHTAVSGRFAFPDYAPAEVYVVNANGERVESGMVQKVREDDRHFYDLRIPGDHFAVLVKKP